MTRRWMSGCSRARISSPVSTRGVPGAPYSCRCGRSLGTGVIRRQSHARTCEHSRRDVGCARGNASRPLHAGERIVYSARILGSSRTGGICNLLYSLACTAVRATMIVLEKTQHHDREVKGRHPIYPMTRCPTEDLDGGQKSTAAYGVRFAAVPGGLLRASYTFHAIPNSTVSRPTSATTDSTNITSVSIMLLLLPAHARHGLWIGRSCCYRETPPIMRRLIPPAGEPSSSQGRKSP
jgi:hypothetical protein